MRASNEPAPAAPRRLHPTQVRLAFGGDPARPSEPAVMLSSGDGLAALGFLGEERAGRYAVREPGRLAEVLARRDVCRLDGLPLVLVNRHYRVMGVAVGPPVPPDHLLVNPGVSRIEDGAAVEIPAEDGQPSWHLFAVEEAR